MKISLFFLILLFPAHYLFSQTSVSGNIYNENQIPLSGVLVVNIYNDLKTFTDENGHFVINANSGNELRFVRQNYDRTSAIVTSTSYLFGLNVTMVFAPTDIEEVKLYPKLSGDLDRDLDKISIDTKTQKLQQELAESMKFRPVLKSVEPQLSVPSEFAPRDFSKGQVNLFDINGGGIVGLFTKLIIKKPNLTEPNYNETQIFLKRLKENINKNYYYNLGMSEEQLDLFLAEANSELKLAKIYRNKFNTDILESILKNKLKTYAFKSNK